VKLTADASPEHAQSPEAFGRRIRAELMRVEPEHREATTSKRPVLLAAKHRPIPPEVAATVAQALLDVGVDVYTPSMAAAAYVRGAGADDAAVISLYVRWGSGRSKMIALVVCLHPGRAGICAGAGLVVLGGCCSGARGVGC
jgi:hypothetical protein